MLSQSFDMLTTWWDSIAITLVLACGYLYWGYQLVTLLRVSRRVPLLERLPEETRGIWPRVSVIMTACNEEAALESALQVRLADDYPNLELVLVEDRSTDKTAEIAARLAASDVRMKLLHISELPPGWLGKLHAMQHGYRATTGEWLLFSDADVAVAPGVLRRVVAHCERHDIDHCLVVPSCRSANVVLASVVAVFVRIATLGLRIWDIEDPRSSASFGVGAFNLVRRRAFEQTQGFEWLKMEVADDVALGQMLKDAGAKQSLVNGRGLTSFMFHPTLRDTLRAVERASYSTIGNFSAVRLTVIGVTLALLELSPLLALGMSSSGLAVVGSVGLLLVAAASMMLANGWLKRPASELLLAPLGAVFWAYACIRSGVLGRLRRGIFWRGTFYGDAELKAGRRLRV